jgi:hypothetical protein
MDDVMVIGGVIAPDMDGLPTEGDADMRTIPIVAAALGILCLAAPQSVTAAIIPITDGYNAFSDTTNSLDYRLTHFSSAVPLGTVSAGMQTNYGSQLLGLQGGGTDFIGTTAQILETLNAGNFSVGWRNRAVEERPSGAATPPMPIGTTYLGSDVVDLTGSGGNTYVLQLDYTVSPGDNLADGFLFLAELDNSVPTNPMWKNAGNGSVTGSTDNMFAESYSDFRSTHGGPLSRYVGEGGGYWGVDLNTYHVWAVVTGDGMFSVVPEPGTIALLAAGAAGLLAVVFTRWKKSK